jgi:hypothetical protein
MVKENIIIPKENLAQVEEVREIETNQPTITENVKEAVVPTVHASDSEKDEKQKEGAKNIIGGVSSATGGVASVPLKVVGKTAEGIGQASDTEGLEEAGKIYSEGANKPVE